MGNQALSWGSEIYGEEPQLGYEPDGRWAAAGYAVPCEGSEQ
jgi:hypothetical protein